MKILLTGARGFTGRFFMSAAMRAGHEVLALRANLADKKGILDEVLTIAPEYVVHLGAISFVNHVDDADLYAVNAVGTTHLLQALEVLPTSPKKIVIASSANVYGNCERSPISEIQVPAPINHYAMSKLAMEYMVRVYMEKLPIVITRPFNYTGSGQSINFLIPKLVNQYALRAATVELGNLQVEREFNDVRMVCNAYLALLDHGVAGEVYNVCSGTPNSLSQVIEMLNELAGYKMEIRINQKLVRVNEVRRLCGDPAKLDQMCVNAHIELNRRPLREMLQWMLAEAMK